MAFNRNSTNSGGGGGGSSTPSGPVHSFLSEGSFISSLPFIPAVSQDFSEDLTGTLTTLAGTSVTTGSGITGLTEGSYCEISTDCIIDNITGQTCLYLELVNAGDAAVSYQRSSMLTNKVDSENPGKTDFAFVVTPEMALDGVRVHATGHRGSAGTQFYDFIHTVKQFS